MTASSDTNPARKGLTPEVRRLTQEWMGRNTAENERLRAERSARRYKAERDPAEYEKWKERQRQEYADGKGGVVRRYEKIGGKTKAEHNENAKARHTELERERYAKLSPEERQAKSDEVSDRAFCRRLRKNGKPEEEIDLLLLGRVMHREAERAAKAEQEFQRIP